MHTHCLCWLRGVLFTAPMLLLVTSFLAPAVAQDEAPRNALIFAVNSKTSSLSLIEKTSRVIQLKARIRTVDGFDPTVVRVTAVGDPTQIRVQAVAPGVTSLVLVDENDASYTIEVLVSGDVKHLEAIIRRAYPDSSVQAIKVKDSVLLAGWVNQPDQLTTIVEIAEQFHPKVLNSLHVSGIQQVMLQVKIMEVQRGKIRNLGFNFAQLSDNSFVTSTPGNIAPLTSLAAVPGAFPIAAMNPSAATATFGIISDNNVFRGFIEALKQEALLKVLAEPNLLSVNGRPANFLSGGEFPILVPQGVGTVSIQFKPFGVSLEFVPTVLGNGRARMDVRAEVSEKDFTNTVTVGSTVVPGLTVRRANTQVEMGFGQTLVIAGLISNRVQSRTQKIPYLGDLPWIGAAFRRVSHDESETELLILVTPEFVAPIDKGELPPLGPGENTVSPTDTELYINGVMETPRSAPEPDLTMHGNMPAGPQYLHGTGLPPAPPAMLSNPPAAAPSPPTEVPNLPPPVPSEALRSDPYEDDTPRASTRPFLLPPAPPVGDSADSASVGPPNATLNNIARRDMNTRNGAVAMRPSSTSTGTRPGLLGPDGTASAVPTPPAATGSRPGLIAP